MRVEVDVTEEERVILLTVGVGVEESFNDMDPLELLVMHDELVDVLLDAMVRVCDLVLSTDGLDVVVAV